MYGIHQEHSCILSLDFQATPQSALNANYFSINGEIQGI